MPIHTTALADRKRRAFAAFPDTHRRPPNTGEEVLDAENGHIRCQDYACTQGFAVVITSREVKKRTQVVLKCSRHGKKTRDTRKNKEKPGEKKRERPNQTLRWHGCPYKIRIMYYKRDAEWRLTVVDSTHNHEMLDDPFSLPEHYSRDPDRAEAHTYGLDLRTVSTSFSVAKQAMTLKGLRVSPKEYYNLIRTGAKRTPQEEVRFALKVLEDKGFHVRVKESYIIEQNIRQKQQIDHFFFCNAAQIRIARQFASGFIAITDATFNTNENELPLSVLVCVTNTLKSFPFAYCYISSESTEAFVFMNACMKELFFYDACRGPAVLLGDFAAGLTAAMTKRQNLTISEAGVEIAWRLTAEVDKAGNDCILQLCNWHAAEAIKKRLTKAGYPAEAKKPLASAVWTWINSPTVSDIAINRQTLCEKLHIKESDYVSTFYVRQEHQFITAHTRLLPNLGCRSTQRGESMHPIIKRVTNRHTQIGTSVQKIAEEVEDLVLTYTSQLNDQKRGLPSSIDGSREAFSEISRYITHQAIDLLIVQWNAAKTWFFDAEDDLIDAPPEGRCSYACDLPRQFGLPCKCWLYHICRRDIPIPISLIHPRWLFKAPEVVAHWEMSLDPSISVEDYQNLNATEGSSDSDSDDSSSSNRGDNIKTSTEQQGSLLGDKFKRRGAALIEKTTLNSMEYHKKIRDAHQAEEFAREQAILMARLQPKYDKRREIDLPISFAVAKKSEEALLYKKGQSRRRRAMTGREAADQAETVERNRRHAQSLEQSRIKKHKQIMTQEAENRPSEFSQLNFPEGRQASEASAYSGVDGGIPSDDDIEFLGTQPVQVPYTQPPRENCQVVGHSQKGKGRRTSFSSDSDTGLRQLMHGLT